MNSTSFFYAHTDQWRYEKLGVEEILSPLAAMTNEEKKTHHRLQCGLPGRATPSGLTLHGALKLRVATR